MNITEQELLSVFSPLILALHEKGVLDISETAHLYEDVLARRLLGQKEDAESVAFLKEVVLGLHRLASAVKSQQTGPIGQPPM